MNDMDYLSISLFLIILIILCTLLIINAKKNIELESFKDHEIPFSIIYHSRPKDMIWEIKNNKINNKYLNVVRLKPLYVKDKDFYYKPVGQYINVTDEPLLDLNDIKDNISLNLCCNNNIEKNRGEVLNVWNTNNLEINNETQPFTIYQLYNDKSISCIITPGINNEPNTDDYSYMPNEFVNIVNINRKNDIFSIPKSIILNKTNEFVNFNHDSNNKENIVLIDNFFEKHINNKKAKPTRINLYMEEEFKF